MAVEASGSGGRLAAADCGGWGTGAGRHAGREGRVGACDWGGVSGRREWREEVGTGAACAARDRSDDRGTGGGASSRPVTASGMSTRCRSRLPPLATSPGSGLVGLDPPPCAAEGRKAGGAGGGEATVGAAGMGAKREGLG